MANFAIVGATGLVGTKMIERLGESKLRVDNIYLMASARSAGKVLQFRGQDVIVEELNEGSLTKKSITQSFLQEEILLVSLPLSQNPREL